MEEKKEHVFWGILFIGCFLCAGIWMGLFTFPFGANDSPLEIQERYASQLENKLVHLLEPAAGIGNIRAIVQASIRPQNSVKKQYDPFRLLEKQIYQEGPVLENQSVSVLINEREKSKLSSYKNLIEAAIGYDAQRGDRLSVEMLPFARVPLWTLGLNPITLVRILVGLIICILVGLFWLIKEGRKAASCPPIFTPNPLLWEKAENLSVEDFALALQKKRPEIIATILYHLTIEKASELMDFFPERLKNQISLHLTYIEKLGVQRMLLEEAEKYLYHLLEKAPQANAPLNQLLSWKDEDIQNLLHYVHKADFIKALRTTPDAVQKILKRHIPPALWQELVHQMQTNPCPEKESFQIQKKILCLAELLKKGN